ILRRDLEGKGLAVFEHRAAIETETGNAQNGELHGYHIARLAARIVTRRIVDRCYLTIRKGGGIEARRFKCVLIEPETDGVLRLHVFVAPCRPALLNDIAGMDRLRVPKV